MEIRPLKTEEKADDMYGLAQEYARAYLMDTDTPLEDVIFRALAESKLRQWEGLSRMSKFQEEFTSKVMDKK